jgi:predicted permease
VRRLVVVTQLALGVVLLVGAGLLLRSFAHLRALEPGFDGNGVYAASVSLQDARYQTASQVNRLATGTLDRLTRSPGVEAAAVSLGLPYERLLNLGFRHLDGPEAAGDARITSATYIAGDYFGALHIPVKAGRTFDSRDTTASLPVAIVNETTAREYFNGANPVGRRIRFAGAEREIVGVVGDVQVRPGFGDRGPIAPMPLAYIPLSQAGDGMLRLVHGWFATSFIARTGGSMDHAAPLLRQAVDAVDPMLPFAEVRSMADVQRAAVAQPRLLMVLLVTLAAAAVVLSAIGIHGLISSSVTERTREMGIRIALGATSARAVRTAALPGVVLAVVGIVIGGIVARAATALIESFVWGVRPTDPATYAAVTALFIAVAVIASVLPALRILRLDPARTLRAE